MRNDPGGITMIEPEYKFSRDTDNFARAKFDDRGAAIEDMALRKWCIEQIEDRAQVERAIDEAQKLYDWVRNLPKADAA